MRNGLEDLMRPSGDPIKEFAALAIGAAIGLGIWALVAVIWWAA